MKQCFRCEIELPETQFYSNGRGGTRRDCKECFKSLAKERRRHNPLPKKVPKIRADSYLLYPKGENWCPKCQVFKKETEFYRQRDKPSGYTSHCKECIKESQRIRRIERGSEWKSVRKEWESKNKELLREKRRIYATKNQDKRNLNSARRRARKKNLPDTLTVEEVGKLLDIYIHRCAICGDGYEHLDHFIPLATERGGTTIENTAPMCARCNSSKNAANPFEWAEKLECTERERFYYLVKYLAQTNSMTFLEYREYVESCFE